MESTERWQDWRQGDRVEAVTVIQVRADGGQS